jgi:glycosyltransferase involved in cell wall biosynthesis
MVAQVAKTDYSASTPFRIVWEGMPQVLKTLAEILPAIDELRRRQAIEIHVVTDRTYAKYLGRYGRTDTLKMLKSILGTVCFHEWREEDCARIICSCDLAVIPLPLSDPFIAGKPENKLLLFWRLGMPAVVSATPAYTRAMDAAGVAMYCRTTEEWVLAIEGIMKNRVKREEAARRGKAFVDTNFSEAQLIAAWDEIFKSVAT